MSLYEVGTCPKQTDFVFHLLFFYKASLYKTGLNPCPAEPPDASSLESSIAPDLLASSENIWSVSAFFFLAVRTHSTELVGSECAILNN